MSNRPSVPGSESLLGPEAQAFIQEQQVRAYRKIGVALGLGSDAVKTHAHLSGRVMPAEHVSPEKFRRELAAEGIQLSPDQSAQLDRNIADIHAKYYSAGAPTPFEDPNRYPTLAMIFDGLHADLSAKGQRISPRPHLATLPSGNVDARVLLEPKTRAPIIFFERGLFQFFYDFVLIAGWAVPPLSLQQLSNDAALAELPPRYLMPQEAPGYFSASLYAYVVEGSPALKRSPIPRPSHNLFAPVFLLEHMERFVMAHELAHITLGHLNKAPAVEDEYEADARGFEIVSTLAHQQAGSWSMGYWAVDLALVALNFLYRALGLMAFGPQKLRWISASHPDPLARRQRLRAVAQGGRAPAIGLAAANGLSSMTEAIFQRLWEMSLPGLYEAYQHGARPFPIWKDLITHAFAPHAA